MDSSGNEEEKEGTLSDNTYDYGSCPRQVSEISSDSTMNGSFPTKPQDLIEATQKHNLKMIIITQVVVLFYAIAKTLVALSNAQFLHYVIKYEVQGGRNVTSNGSSVCFVNATDPSFEIETEIQQKTSFKSLQLSVANNGITVIVSLFMGAYSDHIGRKFLFLLPMCGCCIQSTTYALVSHFKAPLNFLFIGDVLCGLGGGFVTFLLACFAMASDLTRGGKHRTFYIAVYECIGYFAIGLSMLTLGYIIKYVGFTVVFVISVSLTIFGILVILIFIKNPQFTKETDLKPNFRQITYNIYHFYTSNEQGTRLMYQLCLLIFIFAIFSAITSLSVFSVYLLGRPLCYDSVQIGYFMAAQTLIGSIASMAYVFAMQRCTSDIIIGMGGAISFTAFLMLMSFSKSTSLLFTAVAIGGLGVSAPAMIRAIMSKLTPRGQHGALFASISCIEAIITTVSSVIGNAIYEKTVATFSGAVFFIMSCFYGITIFLFIALWFVKRRASRDPELEPILNHEKPEI